MILLKSYTFSTDRFCMSFWKKKMHVFIENQHFSKDVLKIYPMAEFDKI